MSTAIANNVATSTRVVQARNVSKIFKRDAFQVTALDNLTRAETIASVRAAVRSLPPVYREVVVLCNIQEMNYEQAAAIIGCPVGTVRSRLHRARAMLINKLRAMGEAQEDERRQPARCAL